MAAQVPCRYRDPYSLKSTLPSGHPAGIHCIEAWSKLQPTTNHHPPVALPAFGIYHVHPCHNHQHFSLSRLQPFSHPANVLLYSGSRSPLLLPLVFLLSLSFSLQYHFDCSGPHSLLGRESQTHPFLQLVPTHPSSLSHRVSPTSCWQPIINTYPRTVTPRSQSQYRLNISFRPLETTTTLSNITSGTPHTPSPCI